MQPRAYRIGASAHDAVLSLIILAVLVLSVFAFPHNAFASTPLVASAKITGPNTVTITYSQSVYTTLNDYGSFTGALSAASLASVSGSGSNVITLTFNGSPFSSSATGGLTIASSVTSTIDGASLGSGPYNIVDGQSPLISSFSLSSNLAGGTVARAGDTISVTFNTSESLNNVSATIDGSSVSLNGSGSGPYTASYTISSSDQQDVVPVSVTMTDSSGNRGTGSFTLGGGIGPHIVSITSDANTPGALNAGGTINFVVTLSSPATNAYVNGSYDGVPLSWTTNNGGATYNATFTLQNSSPSTAAPLQISGVTVRDSSGNVSVPVSGSDIQKTLNPQSFSLTAILSVSSPVPSGTSPKFGFYSPQDGTITYGGSCSSPMRSVITGNNYITLSPLPDGVYSNCTVTVADGVGYQSGVLTIPSFVVGAGGVSNPVPPTSSNSGTSNPAYAYKFYTPLDVGSTGADVTALQQRLTAEGIYSGPVTGYYGSLTKAAVQKFQSLHGLQQLGNVGPGTRAALNNGL